MKKKKKNLVCTRYKKRGLPVISNETKWLIYDCKFNCAGWADRLKGIMSVYALSIMTRRQFLIDIEIPCNFSQLFVPNKIDWSMKSNQIKERKNFMHIDCLNQIKLGPECLSQFEERLDENQNLVSSPTFLALKSNQEWISFFARKKSFHKQIIHSGYVDSIEDFKFSLMFNKWYKKLFKLTPEMSQKYELLKRQARLDKSTRIYCAQIRIGGARPNVKFDAKFNDMKVKDLFWKFIRQNFIRKVIRIPG